MKLDRQFLRFVVTGLLATALHVLVAAGLIVVAHQAPVFANMAAFCISNAISFFIHSRWSFGVPASWGAWRRYILVSLGGVVLTWLVAELAERMALHYGVGIALVVTLVPLLSFGLHRQFTFARAL